VDSEEGMSKRGKREESLLPPSEMAKLRGMKLWISTPCYGGVLTDIYSRSILMTQHLFWQLGVELFVYFVRNESNVCRARNECVAAFLGRNLGYTHFMFIDSDMGWEATDVVKFLLADQDVLAGAYRKKTEKDEYTVTFAPGNFTVERGMCEVERAGCGFLMIKRSVFDRMMEYYPDLKTNSHSALLSAEEQNFVYGFFENKLEPDNYWGEDYAFCNRWRAMGGKVFCEINTRLDHLGSFVFKGDVRRMLTAPRPGADQAILKDVAR
jgi:hypothetical protein